MFALIFLSNLDRMQKKRKRKKNRNREGKEKLEQLLYAEFVTSGRMEKKNPRSTLIIQEMRMYATSIIMVLTFRYSGFFSLLQFFFLLLLHPLSLSFFSVLFPVLLSFYRS
jgi:hypothetical protein